MARGDLTPDAVRRMETQVDRAVDELSATGVDVIAYADMVTTFIMEPGWNEDTVASIAEKQRRMRLSVDLVTGCASQAGDSSLRLGYPLSIINPCTSPSFFEARGFELTGHATLDILAMRDVPKVDLEMLRQFVAGLPKAGAEAIVLLATDLPTFASLDALEADCGCPVLSSNQVILWAALRACGVSDRIPGLGQLFKH